ncbi:hypothetical protein D8674_031429 [Pyrus ussuriensis x Pyrus communis]|uniref:Uncharacterized protein n=1 Tax=Pyrus ussuriensis x Pyrus communis TaxID=2448454 RepID=A0A5N5EYJ4_9ROSA|nr:hypothetical protein D8674_031429 [Pyrus ussuriensis x Pyrus communis]
MEMGQEGPICDLNLAPPSFEVARVSFAAVEDIFGEVGTGFDIQWLCIYEGGMPSLRSRPGEVDNEFTKFVKTSSRSQPCLVLGKPPSDRCFVFTMESF